MLRELDGDCAGQRATAKSCAMHAGMKSTRDLIGGEERTSV